MKILNPASVGFFFATIPPKIDAQSLPLFLTFAALIYSKDYTMRTWFTVKIKYTKQMEDGALKRVTEAFLFDANSFTEAEARAIEEVAMSIKGEVLVTNIAKTELADVIHFGDCDTWYKVKVSFVSYDADTEKEKRMASNVLVNAPDITEAVKRTNESFKDSISAFEVLAAAISPIVEIYAYDDSEPEMPQPIGEIIEAVSKVGVYSAPSLDEDEDTFDDDEDGPEIVDEYQKEEKEDDEEDEEEDEDNEDPFEEDEDQN